MASRSDIWPMAPVMVEPGVKEIITRFFQISDSTDPDSGRLFAEELFAEDGFFKTHETCIFKGREAIAACREGVPPLLMYRKHELFQVFAANSPATDLIVLGRFIIGYKAGIKVDVEFTSRFIVTQDWLEAGPKLQAVQVWTDPTESLAAQERVKAILAEKDQQ